MRNKASWFAVVLSSCLGVALLGSSAKADTIQPAGLMKDPATHLFTSSYMLKPPPSTSIDASPRIQAAINAVGLAGCGGVVFVGPGTYYIKETIKIKGYGVKLVGIRDPNSQEYPTFLYGNDLTDVDYENRSTLETNNVVVGSNDSGDIHGPIGPISVLEHPAVVRMLGNGHVGVVTIWNADDYSVQQSYSCQGMIGFNIVYNPTAGSGTVVDGQHATGLAINAVHQSICRDITINGAWNGVDLGGGNSPFFRNIDIENLPDSTTNFGMHVGAWDAANSLVTNGVKVHGLTVRGITGNTHSTLVTMPINGSIVGAALANGGLGIRIGSSPTYTNRGTPAAPIIDFMGDAFLRTVKIDNVAQQGILLDFTHESFMYDITINHAGGNALETTPQYTTGLLITDLRTTYAGLNAIHLGGGMNIDITDASLLDSNQLGAAATGAISIDGTVTSCNVCVAHIGSTGLAHENFIMSYAGYPGSTNLTTGPWSTHPQILASYVGPLPIASMTPYSNVSTSHCTSGDYNTIKASAYHYFDPPDEDTWPDTQQRITGTSNNNDPTPPSGPLNIVRGFNYYDLPAIGNGQWIDINALTAANTTPTGNSYVPVVDHYGLINSTNFSHWLNVAAAQSGIGGNNGTPFVLYMPSGYFTNLGQGAGVTYTPYGIAGYKITAPLLLNQPNVQLVGDGPGVTTIKNFTPSGSTYINNPDSAIKLIKDSSNDGSGSGVFGLSVLYAKALLTPGDPPYKVTPSFPAGSLSPAILAQGTPTAPLSNIRLADIEVDYALYGAVRIFDVANADVYCLNMNGTGVHSITGVGSNPSLFIGATSDNSCHDIRLCQIYGEFAGNIFDPALTHGESESKGDYISNARPGEPSVADCCNMDAETVPDLTYIQVVGGVRYVRADYCTFIRGVNGLATYADSNGVRPQHISSVLFATDHTYRYALDLEGATGSYDFVANWILGRKISVYVASSPAVDATIRFSTQLDRGSGYEALYLNGGSSISIVNSHIGNAYNAWTPYSATTQTRPQSDIYLGPTAGKVLFVGGSTGWLGNSNEALANVNNNKADFGFVYSPTNTAGYTVYGTDLYGNYGYTGMSGTTPTYDPPASTGRIGRQTANGGTASTVISANVPTTPN